MVRMTRSKSVNKDNEEAVQDLEAKQDSSDTANADDRLVNNFGILRKI